MQYVFLNIQFYKDYDPINYPEILRKKDRPYVMVKITIGELDIAIPFRSNINHPNVFWTDETNKRGLDYSKAIVISEKYIDNSRKPHIRDIEHKALKGKKYLVIKGFERYIRQYKKALKKLEVDRNKSLCEKSTLQYFHKELNIT